MRIGIYYHKNKVPEDRVRTLEAMLEQAGVFVRTFLDADEIGEVDRLIVLGGDGSVRRGGSLFSGSRSSASTMAPSAFSPNSSAGRRNGR